MYVGVYEVAGNCPVPKDVALAMLVMEKKVNGSLDCDNLRLRNVYACQRDGIAAQKDLVYRAKDMWMVVPQHCR